LAGGTGSGLGAHLIEKMREDYPKSMILNTSIWPYSTGEVILQNYNVLLTLASSLEHADAILPLYNDDILTTCRHLLKENRPSYKTMNTVIAQSLLSFLYPCANSPKAQSLPLHNPSSSYSYGPLNILSEIQEHLLNHPSDYYKLLTVKNIPQCSNKVT
jgi:tubulin delta